MKLTFIGADHEVTGSCHLIEACGKNILVDCGMEQGPDLYENQEIPVTPGDIDYILLTHAHIDHSGKIPLLCKEGFKGDIITTFATADLCNIMLRDSAHIQEFEAEWRNRKAKRSGAPEYEPLYTMEHAEAAIKLLYPCDYNQRITLCDGIEVQFTDVGHLLGSSAIEVWITEDGISKKIVFSGDVGNLNQPIIKDPQKIGEADYVVIESTYGNRVHGEEIPDYVGEFTRILRETFEKGGNVMNWTVDEYMRTDEWYTLDFTYTGSKLTGTVSGNFGKDTKTYLTKSFNLNVSGVPTSFDYVGIVSHRAWDYIASYASVMTDKTAVATSETTNTSIWYIDDIVFKY